MVRGSGDVGLIGGLGIDGFVVMDLRVRRENYCCNYNTVKPIKDDAKF